MRLMRRPFGPLAGLLIAFVGLWLLSGGAHAQTAGGLGSLIQGLSPQEQQAILGRLGAGNLGGGTSTITQLPGQLGAMGSLNPSQQQQYQQEMAVRRLRSQEEQQPLIPVLKGSDWVIIQIGFHLPRAPVNESALALQQLYAGQGGAYSSLSPQQLQALQALQQGSSGNTSALAQAAASATPAASQLTPAEQQRLTALRDLIRARNP